MDEARETALRTRVELGVLTEPLPLLWWRRRICRLRHGRRLLGHLVLAGHLGPAPDRAERFAFGTLDLGRICAAPAFEVEVLADGVIE